MATPDPAAATLGWQGAARAGVQAEDEHLLGDYPEALVRLSASGTRLADHELLTYRVQGERAAEGGVPLRVLIELYLSATWRMWRHLPAVHAGAGDLAQVQAVGESVLRAADDVLGALAEGYQATRRALVRRQEAARREFIDDLLTGRSGVASLLERAAHFGLDLAGPHAVAVVRADRPFADGSPLMTQVERVIDGDFPPTTLVASKGGLLVVVFAAADDRKARDATTQITRLLGPRDASGPVGCWQLGLGRRAANPAGIMKCYNEAVAVLDLAQRLGRDDPVMAAGDLLVYQVLLRDRTAVVDLIRSTLSELEHVRGGAAPLLETLHVYFDTGGNAAETARRLHLSVRAVGYRLDRVRHAIDLDLDDGHVRFTVQAAVLGARLLDWPRVPLPTAPD